mmetsp:Transcript_16645/g.46995  ORF Transcript_16645/g.46995 Transcript_16645/m.46995 type:complete len:209 (+) Transcript_16645:337-963(+)
MQMQTLPNTTIDVFVDSLVMALENIVHKEQTHTSPEVTRFHAPRIPNISVRKYVERIVNYAPCTVECFVVALVYLDRLQRSQGYLFINPATVHRIFITSVLLAAKYCDDIYFNNKYYARVGGISCQEMNSLELEFLFRCKFDCNVSAEEFNTFSHVLYEPTVQNIPRLTFETFQAFSVSPHTHSFLYPACGSMNDNRSRSNRRVGITY